MSTQLALNLRLRDASSLENFLPGANRELLDRLRRLPDDPESTVRTLLVWGEGATGKTHLLEAACRHALARDETCYYVPLAEVAAYSPEMLEGFEQARLVCLDDLDRIAGNADWELALFRLWERIGVRRGLVLISARAAPAGLGLALPDLVTRLAAGLVYQLRALSDEEKIAAMRLRAHNRGLELGDEVARYILGRQPRDLRSLFDLLDRIDARALQSKRRITVPFVRELIA